MAREARTSDLDAGYVLEGLVGDDGGGLEHLPRPRLRPVPPVGEHRRRRPDQRRGHQHERREAPGDGEHEGEGEEAREGEAEEVDDVDGDHVADERELGGEEVGELAGVLGSVNGVS